MHAAADAPAKLVQLAETEALGILDQHQGCVRHVHADLDDCGRDQHIDKALENGLHDRVLLGGFHPAVNTGNPQAGQFLSQALGLLHRRKQLPCGCLGALCVLLFHLGADDKHLSSLAAEFADESEQAGAVTAVHTEGLNPAATGGKLVQQGHIQVPVDDQSQRARDRSRRHDIQMRRKLFPAAFLRLCEPCTLLDTEAVLFVGDGQRQTGKAQAFGEQGVSPDDQIQLAVIQLLLQTLPLGRLHRACQQTDAQTHRRKESSEGLIMLLCQDLSGRHQKGEMPGPGTLPDQGRCRQRFAAADVALQQTVHLPPRGEVCGRLGDRAALGRGRTEGELGIESLEIRQGQGNAGCSVMPPHAEGTGEQKQLFKDKAPPRLLEGGKILGEMNGPVGLPCPYQAKVPEHRLRKQLRNLTKTLIQACLNALAQGTLRQPGTETVNRHDGAGDGKRRVLRLENGVGQTAQGAADLHLPVEAVAFAAVNLISDIGLVKIADVHPGAAVKGVKAHDFQPAADTAETRLITADGRDADALAVLDQRDGLYPAAVLIAPREIGNQVKQRKDAQLSQSLRPFLADTPDAADILLQGIHRHSVNRSL